MPTLVSETLQLREAQENCPLAQVFGPQVQLTLAPRKTGLSGVSVQNFGIALDHSGVQHRLQFHHIFPKAVLKGTYSTREADDIANLCFISGKTNRHISAKEPQVYFTGVMESAGTAAFDKQCIPHEPSLLGIEHYKLGDPFSCSVIEVKP